MYSIPIVALADYTSRGTGKIPQSWNAVGDLKIDATVCKGGQQ